MSTKIVRVDQGDYKLIVGTATASGGNRSAGSIVLDTNLAPFTSTLTPGTVVINGNLEVIGSSTWIQSTNLTVTDKVIVLNDGELSNNGVSGSGNSGSGSGTSGIKIYRGPIQPSAFILWNDTLDSVDPSGNVSDLENPTYPDSGTFIFADANNNLRAIATNSINTYSQGSGKHDGLSIDVGSYGDSPDAVISVQGLSGDPFYEKRVLRYDGDVVENIIFNIVSVQRVGNVAYVAVDTDLSSYSLVRVKITCTTDGDFSGTFITVESVGVNPDDTVNSFIFSYNNVGSDYSNISANGTVQPDIIINDNYIPNIRAVAEYANVALSGITIDKIVQNDTKIQVYDSDSNPLPNSLVTVEVDGTNILQIDGTNGVLVNQQLILHEDTIGHTGAAAIGYTGTYTHPAGQLHIDTALNIKNWTQTTPSVTYPGGTSPNGYVRIYSTDTPGTGGTGLYFVNATGTNDELISKTKALLYSLIL
jgi:hypothetical protein